MSARSRPDAFADFRPRRGRAVAWWFLAASLLVFGALALLIPTTGYPGWSVSDSLLVLGLGVSVAALMWRFASLRAVPTADGLTVRNVLLTRTVAWSDVERVRFGGGDAWAWLDLADGDDLAVMAVQRADGQHAREQAARLAALVAARGGSRPR